MFIEVLELIGCFMAGGGASFVGAKLFKGKSKAKCTYGTDPWLCRGTSGFKCPKCYTIGDNKNHPQICECSEYPLLHFHFKCASCGYKNIMRTGDDP